MPTHHSLLVRSCTAMQKPRLIFLGLRTCPSETSYLAEDRKAFPGSLDMLRVLITHSQKSPKEIHVVKEMAVLQVSKLF